MLQLDFILVAVFVLTIKYVPYLIQPRIVICIYYVFLGSACCTRVVRYLHQLYPTPKDAEKDLLVDKENAPQVPDSTDSVTLVPDGTHVDDLSATLIRDVPVSRTSCIDWFHQLSPLDQMELITSLYQHHVSMHHSGLHVPPNFLELSLKAMSQLKKSGRSNILFGLAKGLGLQRDDGSGSLIPTNRMPMGLLEYVINFYQSSKVIILIVNCVLSLL